MAVVERSNCNNIVFQNCNSFVNTFFPLKIYGAAVTFFELLPEEQLTESRKEALKLNDDEVS